MIRSASRLLSLRSLLVANSWYQIIFMTNFFFFFLYGILSSKDRFHRWLRVFRVVEMLTGQSRCTCSTRKTCGVFPVCSARVFVRTHTCKKDEKSVVYAREVIDIIDQILARLVRNGRFPFIVVAGSRLLWRFATIIVVCSNRKFTQKYIVRKYEQKFLHIRTENARLYIVHLNDQILNSQSCQWKITSDWYVNCVLISTKRALKSREEALKRQRERRSMKIPEEASVVPRIQCVIPETWWVHPRPRCHEGQGRGRGRCRRSPWPYQNPWNADTVRGVAYT